MVLKRFVTFGTLVALTLVLLFPATVEAQTYFFENFLDPVEYRPYALCEPGREPCECQYYYARPWK